MPDEMRRRARNGFGGIGDGASARWGWRARARARVRARAWARARVRESESDSEPGRDEPRGEEGGREREGNERLAACSPLHTAGRRYGGSNSLLCCSTAECSCASTRITHFRDNVCSCPGNPCERRDRSDADKVTLACGWVMWHTLSRWNSDVCFVIRCGWRSAGEDNVLNCACVGR